MTFLDKHFSVYTSNISLCISSLHSSLAHTERTASRCSCVHTCNILTILKWLLLNNYGLLEYSFGSDFMPIGAATNNQKMSGEFSDVFSLCRFLTCLLICPLSCLHWFIVIVVSCFLEILLLLLLLLLCLSVTTKK